MLKINKPKALPPNGRIGLVSPARWFPPEMLEKGKAELERAGFSVYVHPQTALKHHQLGGPDEERAKALMDLFTDPSIDAILCTRGGTGSHRLLSYLDYNLVAQNPKILCGFSDITMLLAAFHKQAGLIGFHGPMLWNMQGQQPVELMDNFRDMLTGKLVNKKQSFMQAEVLREGNAAGRLVGGNITLLQHLIGTPYDVDTDGAILMIEDTEERWSDVDRSLYHLKRAKKFDKIRGLIVGEFSDMLDERYGPWGDDYKSTLLKAVPPGVPILINYPCGHGKNIVTLPIGAQVSLEIAGKAAFLTLLESPFA
jgi:muramoyltetrapeptide carboxypeptidase